MFRRTRLCTAALLALGGAATIAPQLAWAQSDRERDVTQRVEVTGTRILRPELLTNTPTINVSTEFMGNLGMDNIADVATQLPQFAPAFGSSRTQSTFSGVASSGLNNANLRNLGTLRSLVLINGRRVPGGDSTTMAVDFNTIPSANIDRIEVITGGASAIYGADAVAGVINIITKKNFDGVQVSAEYGESSEGDNKNPTASVLIGGRFGDAGHGLLTLQYDKQGRVSCADRFICSEDFLWLAPENQLRGPAAYSGVGLGGRFFVGGPGVSYTRRGTEFVPWSTPVDGYNRNAQRDIAIPTTRVMAAAEGEYLLGRGIRAFGEFNYGESTVDSSFEGHPFQSNAPGSLYAGVLQPSIPITNPFIPQQIRDLAGDAQEITWWQRFGNEAAGGHRGARSTRMSVRTVAGLQGDFDTLGGFGRDWHWEVSHTFGRTRVNLNTEGLVSTANLYHGLRVEPDPANPGSFRCIDPAARALGCVPINPFAPYTPEMAAALRIGSQAQGTGSLNDTIAHITGSPFQLPAGDVRAVLGAEYRTFGGFLDRDAVVNQGLATGNQISDTDFHKTKTKEVFTELLVPVLANKPFADALNVEGAFRHSEDQRNSYNTWKLGGDWAPMQGLRFRAMKAKAVRSPVPDELSGIGQTFGVVNDPCTQSRRNANPTRAANCDADGIPADYAPPQSVEQSVGGLSGGNPDLAPEEGTTLTFGLVWQPSFVDGLSIAIDRFQVDVDGMITTISRQTAANLCYDTADRLYCNFLTRGDHVLVPGANYVLREVDEQLQNIASQKIAGVDIDVRYALRLERFGNFNFGVLTTIYDKAEFTGAAGTPTIDLLGQAGGSTTDQGYIKYTANANVGWRLGNWSANWNMRHIGRSDMALGTTEEGFPKIGSHTYHNVRVGFMLGKGTEIYAGVTNLFDKQPPFFASGTAGTQALDTIPGYYDVFGRSYFVGAKMKF